MANTTGQHSPPSYIDGISVKISEKYKPPKRIGLAMSYSQLLMLNKLIHEPAPSYDFSLEESIANRMHEWRKARTTLIEDRKQRLRTLSQERKLTKEAETEVTTTDNETNSSTVNSNNIAKSTIEQSTGVYYTESGLLIPMTAQHNAVTAAYPLKGSFNFSEFESDTSSPFDNMELKTINDLEELAAVLKHDVIKQDVIKHDDVKNVDRDNAVVNSAKNQTTVISRAENKYMSCPPDNKYIYDADKYSVFSEAFSNDASKNNKLNGYYYGGPSGALYDSKAIYCAQPVETSPQEQTSIRSVPEIMRSLQQELASTHLETPVEEDVFRTLTGDHQQLVVTISKMGFPMARVARACRAFNGDKKKMVDHLVAVSELLDLGFPEARAMDALIQTDNDRDKALDLLIT